MLRVNAEHTDEELLSLLKADDLTAFDAIYHRHWNQLFQAAFKIIQNETVAEDVVQDVFIDLWTRRSSHQIENLKAYLYQATKFQVFKVIRHHKVVAAYVEQDFILNFATNGGLDNLALNDVKQALDVAVSKLPERCRQVFELSRKGYMTTKEIANHLGISAKTVDNQLHIALKRIRASLNTSFVLVEIVIAHYLKQ